jgi:acyl-CoA synthetase (AMP-forming)/AMP-acid ligase II
MPNCLEFLLAHFAVRLAGGISVLLNARSRQQELMYAIPHWDAEFLFTTDAFDERVNFTRLLEDVFPVVLQREKLAVHGSSFDRNRHHPCCSYSLSARHGTRSMRQGCDPCRATSNTAQLGIGNCN